MIISLPALASFFWYTLRTPHLALPASLIPIGRSVLFLGAAPTEPPKKATKPERSTGRCRFTATGSATSAFVFSQLLGLGSAEEFHNSELPSPSSALSVLAVVLVAGLVGFGEANWLCSSVSAPGPLSLPLISLSAQHRQCRFVCCAGVMSLGSAAEEVPSEVSISDYVSCTDSGDCDLRVLKYQMSACDLFEHMCV